MSEIPPSVNHYVGYRAFMSGGKPRAMSYKTKETTEYRTKFAAYVAAEARRQGWDLVPDKWRHFYVDGVFYFERTDRDANNYWKVLLDAITDTGLIWLDDNVVCERVQRIAYDAKNPRVELHIYPTDYIGVFDNASQWEAFAARCVGCARFARNCSLLQRARIGRVQKEIDGTNCLCYKPLKTETKGENDGE